MSRNFLEEYSLGYDYDLRYPRIIFDDPIRQQYHDQLRYHHRPKSYNTFPLQKGQINGFLSRHPEFVLWFTKVLNFRGTPYTWKQLKQHFKFGSYELSFRQAITLLRLWKAYSEKASVEDTRMDLVEEIKHMNVCLNNRIRAVNRVRVDNPAVDESVSVEVYGPEHNIRHIVSIIETMMTSTSVEPLDSTTPFFTPWHAIKSFKFDSEGNDYEKLVRRYRDPMEFGIFRFDNTTLTLDNYREASTCSYCGTYNYHSTMHNMVYRSIAPVPYVRPDYYVFLCPTCEREMTRERNVFEHSVYEWRVTLMNPGFDRSAFTYQKVLWWEKHGSKLVGMEEQIPDYLSPMIIDYIIAEVVYTPFEYYESLHRNDNSLTGTLDDDQPYFIMGHPNTAAEIHESLLNLMAEVAESGESLVKALELPQSEQVVAVRVHGTPTEDVPAAVIQAIDQAADRQMEVHHDVPDEEVASINVGGKKRRTAVRGGKRREKRKDSDTVVEDELAPVNKYIRWGEDEVRYIDTMEPVTPSVTLAPEAIKDLLAISQGAIVSDSHRLIVSSSTPSSPVVYTASTPRASALSTDEDLVHDIAAPDPMTVIQQDEDVDPDFVDERCYFEKHHYITTPSIFESMLLDPDVEHTDKYLNLNILTHIFGQEAESNIQRLQHDVNLRLTVRDYDILSRMGKERFQHVHLPSGQPTYVSSVHGQRMIRESHASSDVLEFDFPIAVNYTASSLTMSVNDQFDAFLNFLAVDDRLERAILNSTISDVPVWRRLRDYIPGGHSRTDKMWIDFLWYWRYGGQDESGNVEAKAIVLYYKMLFKCLTDSHLYGNNRS